MASKSSSGDDLAARTSFNDRRHVQQGHAQHALMAKCDGHHHGVHGGHQARARSAPAWHVYNRGRQNKPSRGIAAGARRAGKRSSVIGLNDELSRRARASPAVHGVLTRRCSRMVIMVAASHLVVNSSVVLARARRKSALAGGALAWHARDAAKRRSSDGGGCSFRVRAA